MEVGGEQRQEALIKKRSKYEIVMIVGEIEFLHQRMFVKRENIQITGGSKFNSYNDR